MLTVKATVALLIGIFIAVSSAFAADVKYDLDLVHTRIGFSVRHIVVSNVQGDFKTFAGGFALNDKKELTQVEAVIKTASIDTANEERNTHLKSPDFLDVEKFPEIKFVSTKITHEGNSYTVTGNLTIKDVTKPVTLKGELVGMVDKGLDNKPHAGFQAEGKINRKDFHVNFSKLLETGGMIVGDDVKIILDVDGLVNS